MKLIKEIINTCFACRGTGKTQFLYMELDLNRRHELHEAAIAGKEALDSFILLHSKIKMLPCWHCKRKENSNNYYV